MIKYNSIFIKANYSPELLERILRVIRHRGFTVCAFNMSYYEYSSGVIVDLCLSIISDRSVNLLFAQLNKLIDIVFIELGV